MAATDAWVIAPALLGTVVFVDIVLHCALTRDRQATRALECYGRTPALAPGFSEVHTSGSGGVRAVPVCR